MLRIVDSPGTIELLIGKIKNQKNPEILTKKSESGKTLLQHFVERRKLIEDVSDSEWDDFIHHASFFCKTESGKAELLQDVEKRKLQRNTDTSEPSVFSNQQRLKRLLFSGPWDKDSFFTCLGLIHEKTLVPDYWFKGTLDPYLLSNWQAHLHLALLKRDDFSESEKMKAFEYTTILK